MHRAPNNQVSLKIYCTAPHQNIPLAQFVYSFWGWWYERPYLVTTNFSNGTTPGRKMREEPRGGSQASQPREGRHPLGRKQLPSQCWAEENQGPFWLRCLGLTDEGRNPRAHVSFLSRPLSDRGLSKILQQKQHQ